ncbi:hypothetical protein TNCV_554091 [Trichonephila clavipes]|nr:hypothetical protein TNCV_554091 [Trichonephila clavipes]
MRRRTYEDVEVEKLQIRIPSKERACVNKIRLRKSYCKTVKSSGERDEALYRSRGGPEPRCPMIYGSVNDEEI